MHLASSVGVVMMLRHYNPPMRWRPHHNGGCLYDVCHRIAGLVITPMLWRVYVMRSANTLARMCLSGWQMGTAGEVWDVSRNFGHDSPNRLPKY